MTSSELVEVVLIRDVSIEGFVLPNGTRLALPRDRAMALARDGIVLIERERAVATAPDRRCL